MKGLDLPEALCASTLHRVIYLFDYCPASWHVPLIDGHCVPAAAGLLVSPTQNSLKDSSAGTPVTLFHFFYSPSLYHTLSFPLPPSITFSCCSIYYSTLRFLLPFLYSFALLFSADANLAGDLRKFNLNNRSVLECVCAHYA